MPKKKVAPLPPTTAYDRYMTAQHNLSDADAQAAFPLGEDVPWQDKTIQLVIDKYIIEAATGERTGMCRAHRGRPIADIFRELETRLKDENLIDDYFDDTSRLFHDRGGPDWPTSWRWIACFAVTGGSEGHYVHVEVIQGGTRRLMFTGKTFAGMEHAYKMARRCAEHLGA